MKSIRKKMILMFGLPIGILFIVLLVLSYINVKNNFVSLTESMGGQALDARSREVGKLITGYSREMKSLTHLDLFKSGNMDSIKKYFIKNSKKINSEINEGFNDISFVDLKGNSYNSINKLSQVSEREFYKAIVKDNKSMYISEPMVSKTSGEKMFIISNAVKNDNNKTVGILNAVVNLDMLSKITKDIRIGTSGYGWIVGGDGTIIAHPNKDYTLKLNIADADKKGYKNTDQIYKNISMKKSGITNIVTPTGEQQVVMYKPIPDTPNWYLCISVPKADLLSKANQLIKRIIIIIAIVFLLVLLIVAYISRVISKPLVAIAEHLDVVAHADFTREVPDEYLKKDDEIGAISRAVKSMQDSIKNLVVNIIEESRKLNDLAGESIDDVNTLTDHMRKSGITIEEMSAGMQETASATEEMDASSLEIKNSIGKIAESSQHGLETTNSISERAKKLEKSAVDSQEKASDMIKKMDSDLNSAIEESKSVQKIGELTESILDITEQTNLIALNASIEASRAGSAGKSFSVVADEISKLADDSRNAAVNIKKVSDSVVNCVNKLIDNSNEIKEFIGSIVIGDYKSLVKTAQDYFTNIQKVNKIVYEFSNTSKELDMSMTSMVKVIGQITEENTDAAKNTQDISGKVSAVLEKANDTMKLAKSTKDVSDNLMATVSKFKIS